MEGSQSRPPRLLNVQTLKLERFASTAPPYAILSHTWGSNEVTFAEWRAEPDKESEGYRKIAGACRRAAKSGILYVWVDTCCIDKSNNTELSEAINSMYAWYEAAEVCYAYLSDVPGRLARTSMAIDEQQFRKSKWFTRGWTLQELLAPKVVKFYARDWCFLGPLHKMLDLVSQVTRIPQAVLSHSKALSDCSVAQRLSWASRRHTTKPEDEAYSLLGILDVTIDLRYGEGRNAFTRLQKELLTSSGDLSLLAWHNRHLMKPTSGLLASSPADFEWCDTNVRSKSVRDVSEYWMTNVGLKGSLPIVHCTLPPATPSCPTALLLLDCHDEDYPQTTLALQLDEMRATSPGGSSMCFVGPPDKSHAKDLGPGRIWRIDYASTCFARKTAVTIALQRRSISIPIEPASGSTAIIPAHSCPPATSGPADKRKMFQRPKLHTSEIYHDQPTVVTTDERQSGPKRPEVSRSLKYYSSQMNMNVRDAEIRDAEINALNSDRRLPQQDDGLLREHHLRGCPCPGRNTPYGLGTQETAVQYFLPHPPSGSVCDAPVPQPQSVRPSLPAPPHHQSYPQTSLAPQFNSLIPSAPHPLSWRMSAAQLSWPGDPSAAYSLQGRWETAERSQESASRFNAGFLRTNDRLEHFPETAELSEDSADESSMSESSCDRSVAAQPSERGTATEHSQMAIMARESGRPVARHRPTQRSKPQYAADARKSERRYTLEGIDVHGAGKGDAVRERHRSRRHAEPYAPRVASSSDPELVRSEMRRPQRRLSIRNFYDEKHRRSGDLPEIIEIRNGDMILHIRGNAQIEVGEDNRQTRDVEERL